jgi:ATP-binding cassette subfamily B protein
MPPEAFGNKIKNALRIDRAFLLVWGATKKWTILAFILTAIQGLLPLAILYIIKLIVDAITYSVQSDSIANDFSTVAYYIIAAFAVMIFQIGVQHLASYTEEIQASLVTNYVVKLIHEKSISLDLSYYENPEYYDTLHRAQQDGPYRPISIVKGLTSLLQNGVSLIAMVSLLFLFHWSVGIMLFISIVPGVLVQLKYAKERFDWQKKRTQEERRAGYFSYILTSEVFAKEIRIFDIGSHFSRLYDELKKLLMGEKLAISKRLIIADFFAQVVAITFLVGSLFFIAYRAFRGMITVGDMVMYFQAFQRGVNYLKNLLQNSASLHEDNLFVSHFFDFLDIQNKVKEPAQPKQLRDGRISTFSLENVEFTYPGDREPVLKDISFTINRGETVALVGANGAGKSTIVKLLCRLYDPQRGNISFDGISLGNLGLNNIRRRVSVVFQDYAKYYLTARENIWFGDTNVLLNSDKIRTAAKMVNVDSLLESLPQGYDTILGRLFLSGEELSLGEWQKIVLARAFLRDADLVILDEPTSSLDTDTEYFLYKKFSQLTAGKSALIISHRFSTVRMADKIYVIDGGKIIEHGSHSKLMAENGSYADLYRKQTSLMTIEN